METYRDQRFVRARDDGRPHSDLRFQGCTFDNCRLSLVDDPRNRTVVSKTSVVNCELLNCAIGPAHLRDVDIENVRTGDIQLIWGAIFEHVVFRGKLGRLKFNTTIHDPRATKDAQAAFDKHRLAHYESIDWALDVSAARPQLFELRGVPGSKLVLDRDTQCVVPKKALLDIGFSVAMLPAAPRDVVYALTDLLEDQHGDEEVVLVAPTGQSKRQHFQPYINCIAQLHRLGVTL